MPAVPPSITRQVFRAFKDIILKHVATLRVTGRNAAKEAGVKNPMRLTDRELSQYLPLGLDMPTLKEASKSNARFVGASLEPHINPILREKALSMRKAFLKQMDDALPKDFKRVATKQLRESGQAARIKESTVLEEGIRIADDFEAKVARSRARVEERTGIDLAKRRKQKLLDEEDDRALNEFLDKEIDEFELDRLTDEFVEINKSTQLQFLEGSEKPLVKPFKQTKVPGKADIIPLFP